MIILVVILIIAVCAALIGLVLIQNSKGGGLASNMGGAQVANQIMGARKAGDTVIKLTWYVMGVLVALTFVANMVMEPEVRQQGDARENAQPLAPNTVPTDQGAPQGQPAPPAGQGAPQE